MAYRDRDRPRPPVLSGSPPASFSGERARRRMSTSPRAPTAVGATVPPTAPTPRARDHARRSRPGARSWCRGIMQTARLGRRGSVGSSCHAPEPHAGCRRQSCQTIWRDEMSEPRLLDTTGRRRFAAAMPGHRAGCSPANRGMRYAADPPRVEEIIAVMRAKPAPEHKLTDDHNRRGRPSAHAGLVPCSPVGSHRWHEAVAPPADQSERAQYRVAPTGAISLRQPQWSQRAHSGSGPSV
jgi:hypothetical protein